MQYSEVLITNGADSDSFVSVEFVGIRGDALISIYFRLRGSEILNHTLMLQFKSYNKLLMKLKLAAVAIVGDGGLIYLT